MRALRAGGVGAPAVLAQLEPAAHGLHPRREALAGLGQRRGRAHALRRRAGEREQRRAREQHEGDERGDRVAGQAEDERLAARAERGRLPGAQGDAESKWTSTPSSASAAPTWSWTPTDMPPVIATTSAASSAAAIASRMTAGSSRAWATETVTPPARVDERGHHVRARVAHRPGRQRLARRRSARRRS